eukprot:TRINITY_DN31713_c0_g1_i2.p1 TRINITY_DN31713_c0_g1~~TRINITY_DN31713_c0_g1_i2.p1  ORF type:complete len:194 (+),score=69.49 TRINITY_DN31713_c0_g1_i2:60-641(+)
MPTALVALADGTEELEMVNIVNPLRRGGVQVTIASVMGERTCRCARETVITADVLLKDVESDTFDAVVLPGGLQGAKNFAASQALLDLLGRHRDAGKFVTAICASPAVVLADQNIIPPSTRATCFPAEPLEKLMGDRLVLPRSDATTTIIDGTVVTSAGPGTALEFGLTLLKLLCDEQKAAEVAKSMLFQGKL